MSKYKFGDVVEDPEDGEQVMVIVFINDDDQYKGMTLNEGDEFMAYLGKRWIGKKWELISSD